MRQITKEFIAVFMIELVFSLTFFTVSVYGLTISNVKASNIAANSANIEWETDVAAKGEVNYGKSAPLSTSQKESAFALKHNMSITPLEKNTQYLFSIEAADNAGSTALNNNSDKFFNFRTLDYTQNNSLQTSNTKIESGLPFINLTIPEYFNKKVIDLDGSTRPFSSVSLYLNNLNTPIKSLSSNEVGASGRFFFGSLQLQQDNTIRVLVVDQSGIQNEKIFTTSVDDAAPAVKVDNVTSQTYRTNVSLTGIVSEPVIVKVFIDTATTESSVPAKIKGLNTTSIGQNSIGLKWDESKDKDFKYYIIYRSDAGPIAITQPASFNLYVDALVDSSKEYTYQVSAVNMIGNEGPKSEPLKVKTLPDGSVLNAKHSPVDFSQEFRSPDYTINASNKFDIGIRLSKGDGLYKIKLIFEDKAKNNFIFEKNILLDSRAPTVKIISPPAGAMIYENMANRVDIIGKTKPNARVHLFVERLPFVFNASLGTTLPNEFQTIPESELDAGCGLQTASQSSCKGADKSVTADRDGNFKFENVDLSARVNFGTQLQQVPVSEFRDTLLNQEARQAKRTKIYLIATDTLGQRGFAQQTISIGTCWSGNQSWDIIPLTQYQSPTFLSTERIAEGTEALYFYFNYSYIGRGSNAHIQSITLSKACSSTDLIDSRFNISCKILTTGESPTKLNPTGTLSYSVVPLSRYENMDKFLEADWKSFFNALGVNHELVFPFKARITYTHDIIDDQGVYRTATETQTTCQQVSYVLDNTLIDPRSVLPDKLINKFVEGLQTAIDALTKVQQQIDKVIDYVAIGCLYSFLAHLVFKIYRNWIDLASEATFKIKAFAFALGDDNTNQECTDIANAILAEYNLGNKNDFTKLKLKYFSDPNLKKCFPASYAAWQRETNLYEIQRWSCDRIFGHSTPSKWTESKTDENLLKKLEEQKGCEVDQTVRGLKLRAEKCSTFGSKYPKAKDYGINEKCVLVQTGTNAFTLYRIGQPVAGSQNLYSIDYVEGLKSQIDYVIKDKLSEDYYLTASPKSCNELCGITPSSQPKTVKVGDKSVTFNPNPKDKKTEVGAECVTAQTCKEWNANKKIVGSDGELTINSAYRAGYAATVSATDASSCFYDGKKNPNVVSDNPSERQECCCINAKAEAPVTQYYDYKDYDKATQDAVHESKKSSDLNPVPAESLEDMKWSYRYSRIAFVAENKNQDGTTTEHYQYNPNRYIKGRDMPACFGQDNLFYKLFKKEKEVLILNPKKQDTMALQCAYLTGVNQRLQEYKNIMMAMSNCLTTIKKDGRADSGACKELFTQHVCGLLSQVISFFQNGCTPDNQQNDGIDKEVGVAEKMRLGLKGISQGIIESQEEFSQEYENAKLNNLLGIGEGGIARKICLGAFGYDWSLTASNLVDAAYTAPFSTLVQPVTASREFLTIDPSTLRPKYEYRASWIINPGCDFENYRIDMACVSRKEADQYPNQINCGAVGAPSIGGIPSAGTSTAYNNCDCLELTTGEKLYSSFFTSNNIKQNDLKSEDMHRVIDSEYRYDHLKFTLRPDRKILPNMKQNCFPQGYENGVFYFPINDKTVRDILDCSVNPLSGVFSCGSGTSFFSQNGIVQLLEVSINGQNPEQYPNGLTLNAGDKLSVGARVSNTGKDKCMKISIAPDAIEPKYAAIDQQGVNDIPAVLITDQLRIAGRLGNYNAPGLTINLLSQPTVAVGIDAKFIDNPHPPKDHPEYNRTFSPDDKIIIDGYEVNMETGDVVPTSQAVFGTEVKVQQNVVKKSLREETVYKSIIVRKQGAGIEITGVSYDVPQDSNNGIYQWQHVITVNPYQQGTTNEQPKTLSVEIFNLKADRDSYANNADNCDWSSSIVKKPYKITVTEKGVDPNTLEPNIQPVTFTPSGTKYVGAPITISSKITHQSDIKGNPVITFSSVPTGADKSQLTMLNINAIIGYSANYVPLVAGDYRGNIQAVSYSGTTANQQFSFTVVDKPNANK